MKIAPIDLTEGGCTLFAVTVELEGQRMTTAIKLSSEVVNPIQEIVERNVCSHDGIHFGVTRLYNFFEHFPTVFVPQHEDRILGGLLLIGLLSLECIPFSLGVNQRASLAVKGSPKVEIELYEM